MRFEKNETAWQLARSQLHNGAIPFADQFVGNLENARPRWVAAAIRQLRN
jgi:hypothetical protein